MRGRRRSSGLTSREREVLAFIRLGLTNEEIAARLGITLDGAKYHVSQILAKLGVSTREEAAALPGQAPLPWWARALAWSAAAKAAVVAAMLAIVIGLGVMAWAVLSTGGGDSSLVLVTVSATATPSGPTPVPWVDSTLGPSPSPSPFPTLSAEDFALRNCRAEDLRGEVTGTSGAAGNNLVFLTFVNDSTDPCRLEGVPQAHLTDASRNALPATFNGDACFFESDVECSARIAAVLTPGTSLQDVQAAGGGAGLVVEYPNIPPACPVTDASLLLSLPGDGGDISLPFGSVDSCAAVTVGRFQPAAGDKIAPPTPPPIEASLGAPDTVAAGRTLNFVARLANTSTTEAFDFGPLCPNYTVILGQKVADVVHSLNCHAVGSIAADQTVSFAMQLALPATLPPGSYGLDWTLDFTTYVVSAGIGQPTGKYRVTVVAPTP